MIRFNFRNLLALSFVASVLVGCVVDEPLGDMDDIAGDGGSWVEKPIGGSADDPDDDNTGSDDGTSTPDNPWAAGELDWVFDMSVLPEIRIEVTEEQWNDLLMEYDRDSHTVEYIHCDVEFKSKGENHTFVDAGLRLRGNTSRRRPEGNGGEKHKRNNADWHHCHFMLNLRKYQKDDAHELHNVRKMYLKWHKETHEPVLQSDIRSRM